MRLLSIHDVWDGQLTTEPVGAVDRLLLAAVLASGRMEISGRTPPSASFATRILRALRGPCGLLIKKLHLKRNKSAWAMVAIEADLIWAFPLLGSRRKGDDGRARQHLQILQRLRARRGTAIFMTPRHSRERRGAKNGSSSFRSEREAVIALHEAVTKLTTGVARPISDPTQTLTDLFDYWMTEYAHRKLARKTVERYRSLANYVLPHLGRIAVSKLDLFAFEKVFDDLATQPGKARQAAFAQSVQLIASVFDSMFKRAVARYKTLKRRVQ